MKTNTMKYQRGNIVPFQARKAYAYPNAAERHYYLSKALDYALAAATSLGTVTILLFLIVWG